MKYCDTNLFVNAFSGDLKSAKILTSVVKGEMIICTSTITWDEYIWALNRKFKNYKLAIDGGHSFLAIPKINFIELNPRILKMAQEVIEKYNLHPKDAIHVATALYNGITEIISDDSDFDKVKEIKRVPISD